jgi:hypothetical protein
VRVNAALVRRRVEIARVLRDYGVPRLDHDSAGVT